mmetsp:Transcript_1328/g.3255  ORF Transcript_1328/g.3255 Transcript_1328/m.3255 type:complete len:276 (+) Transcript_1328:526-1353(+)
MVDRTARGVDELGKDVSLVDGDRRDRRHLVLDDRVDVGDGRRDHGHGGVRHGTADDRLRFRLLDQIGLRYRVGVVRDKAAVPGLGDGGVVREGAVALGAPEVAAGLPGSHGNVLGAGLPGRLWRGRAPADGSDLLDGHLLNRLLLDRPLLNRLLRDVPEVGSVHLGRQAKVGTVVAAEAVVMDVGGDHVGRRHGAEGADDGSVERNPFLADHLAEVEEHVHVHQDALASCDLVAVVSTVVSSKVYARRPGRNGEGSEKEGCCCCSDHHGVCVACS